MKMKLAGFAGLCLLGSCTEKVPPPPNILFIAVDDLRPELNCYGADQILSPNIDRLAGEGIIFTRAYCNIPVCGASRASILTGKRPTRYRFLTYYTRADEDAPGIPTLPGYIKANNYYTISNSKVFHHADDSPESWDEVWMPGGKGSWRDYITPENLALDSLGLQFAPPFERADVPDNAYKDGKTAEKAIDDLKRLSSMDQPFFLAVGFLKPHLPFNAPEKYWSMYDPGDIVLPENDQKPAGAPDIAMHNSGELRAYGLIPPEGPVSDEMARKLIHGYYACVSYTDAQVGKLLDALRDLGLEENTIVVLWGDHGWNLREHGLWCKHCNFETSLHAPLIFRVPGIQGGNINQNITEFVDIYPTLCDLAGLKVPGHTEGESLKTRLLHPDIPEEDYAVCKWNNGATLVEGKYFYTEWSRQGSGTIARMLYDHEKDPGENINISEDEEYIEVLVDLSQSLHEKWGEEYELDPVEK